MTTTEQRPARFGKLSPEEIAETPRLDAAAARTADSARNGARDGRHEYDLLRVEWIPPSPRNRKHFRGARPPGARYHSELTLAWMIVPEVAPAIALSPSL